MLKIIYSLLYIVATLPLTACGKESTQTTASAQLQPTPTATQDLAPNIVRQMHWEQVFVINADGSVSPRGPISYRGVTLGGPGIKFGRGVSFSGVDFASLQGHDLNAHFEGPVLVIDDFL